MNKLHKLRHCWQVCAKNGRGGAVWTWTFTSKRAALKWRRGAGAWVDAPDAIRAVELLHFVESFAK